MKIFPTLFRQLHRLAVRVALTATLIAAAMWVFHTNIHALDFHGAITHSDSCQLCAIGGGVEESGFHKDGSHVPPIYSLLIFSFGALLFNISLPFQGSPRAPPLHLA